MRERYRNIVSNEFFINKTPNITLNILNSKNIIIDNYFFGVSSVGENGAESLIQFPRKLIPSGM